jgi:hypothetical protein
MLDRKLRRYTPDFLVKRQDKKQIIEVKLAGQVFKDDNQRRFTVISKLCRQRGYEFKVVTDESIRIQPRLNNIKLLWKYARTPIYPQHQIYCLELFKDKREASLKEVTQYFRLKDIGMRVVYSMIYHGVLAIDLMRPINADIIVRLPSAVSAAARKVS